MLVREIAEIDGESHASLRIAPSDAAIILMLRKAWRMRALGVFHELGGGQIDALHAGYEDEVPRSCAKAPSAYRLDGAWRVECPYTVGRVRTCRYETRRERNCRASKDNPRTHMRISAFAVRRAEDVALRRQHPPGRSLA